MALHKHPRTSLATNFCMHIQVIYPAAWTAPCLPAHHIKSLNLQRGTCSWVYLMRPHVHSYSMGAMRSAPSQWF